MRIAVFAVTDSGLKIANRIKKGLKDEVSVFSAPEDDSNKSWLMDTVSDMFNQHEALVFVSAVGIAVRAIAPHIRDKTVDPAVVVVDNSGAFSISLLSGHIGGANDLARKVADVVGAMPVITTATDVFGKPAIDLLMKELGLKTGDMANLRRVSSGILRGESACIFADIPLGRWGDRVKASYNVRPLSRLAKYEKAYEHVVVILDDEQVRPKRQDALVLKVRRVYAGVGFKKGATANDLKRALRTALAKRSLHTYNLKGLASIDIKSEDQALLEAAKYFNVEVVCYPAEELDKATPNISEFVKEKVGAGGVCEPAAILSSKGGKLILPKTVYGKVTVALAEEE